MTLTELRYIVAVAQKRHFGHAAEACFVSQPTLSVAVRKLEDELGVPLFERGPNEISLTPVGSKIIDQAQRVLEQANSIKEIAQSGKDPLKGSLRIGAIYTIGPYLFSHLIPTLHECVPNMPIIVEENYTANLSARLKQGELDVIIVSEPFEGPGIVTQALYDEPFVVVIPGSHPWNSRDNIPAQDIANDKLLLLSSGNCFRDQVLAACPDCKQTTTSASGIQTVLEGSSLETIRHMVVSGMGITVLPCAAAGADRYSRNLLKIKRFSDPIPTRRVILAWRKSFPRTEAIEVVRQVILSCPLSCVTMLPDALSSDTK
ncbi:MAG: hydrogen peroxide-inducible genes activator [Gammaproteobacteria bacterium]|nr:hydrogen peroxide-inducible genes activator [Gammaproteobacteria bacterium]